MLTKVFLFLLAFVAFSGVTAYVTQLTILMLNASSVFANVAAIPMFLLWFVIMVQSWVWIVGRMFPALGQ